MDFINKLKRVIAEKRVFRTIIKRIGIPIRNEFVNIISKFIKINQNKIVCITSRGSYDCNPKWICEEILKRGLPYEIVWAVEKNVNLKNFPSGIKKVYKKSIAIYRELASAKIIIDNSVCVGILGYRKKKKQILIETWHGSLGMKKITKDKIKDKHWIKCAIREGKMTDYIISNSTFEDNVYRQDFWKETPILRYGHARNDILFDKETERIQNIKSKIYTRYNIEPNTKICLYAPTFRENYDTIPYSIDYEKLKLALQKRFGGNWVICTRLHFMIMKKLNEYKISENVININDYPDIQDFMACTDVAITDYSSWICEYMVTKRPGFLFATDIEKYQEKDRSFFYPLNTMPFPLSTNNEELVDNILNFDYEIFVKKCEAFLQDKGSMDDGHASERIVGAIERIINGEEIINK